MIEGIAVLLEKMPGFALRGGFILFVVGWALEAGMRLGVVNPRALQGYVGQVTPILWLVGGAMVLASLILALLPWLWSQRSLFEKRRTERARAEKLLDNIRWIDQESQILLLMMLRQPKGRLPATPMQAFEVLEDRGLIEREAGFSQLFQAGRPRTGEKMAVVPQIFQLRSALDPELSKRVTEIIGQDASVQMNLETHFVELHKKIARDMGFF